MSKLFTRGARTPLKAEDNVWMLDASCWPETRLKAFTLNHWLTVRRSAGSATSAMVWPGSSNALPKPSACPLCSVKMLWICQPLITLDNTLFPEEPHCLPWPKGSSYSTVATEWKGRSRSEITFSGVGSVGFRYAMACINFDQVKEYPAESPAERRFSACI